MDRYNSDRGQGNQNLGKRRRNDDYDDNEDAYSRNEGYDRRNYGQGQSYSGRDQGYQNQQKQDYRDREERPYNSGGQDRDRYGDRDNYRQSGRGSYSGGQSRDYMDNRGPPGRGQREQYGDNDRQGYGNSRGGGRGDRSRDYQDNNYDRQGRGYGGPSNYRENNQDRYSGGNRGGGRGQGRPQAPYGQDHSFGGGQRGYQNRDYEKPRDQDEPFPKRFKSSCQEMESSNQQSSYLEVGESTDNGNRNSNTPNTYTEPTTGPYSQNVEKSPNAQALIDNANMQSPSKADGENELIIEKQQTEQIQANQGSPCPSPIKQLSKAAMNFDSKPKAQSQLCLTQHPQGTRSCKVISNQYRMKISSQLSVFQYVLEVEPMELWDSHKAHSVVRHKRREMDAALGPHVVSGKSIYTLTEIERSVQFKCIQQGQTNTINIDKSTEVHVTLADNTENSNSKTEAMYNLLNIIIKQAFRETNLKQIGKAPRFFDTSRPIELKQHGVQIWSGFKASVVQSGLGTMVCMDSIFKFMSTRSCLEKIDQIRKNCPSQHRWEQLVKLEYCGHAIIANWGNKRTYVVNDVIFTSNPVEMKFQFQGKETSVADYFLAQYNMKVQQPKQPLFQIKTGDNSFFLPPEFCLIDGVSEDIKKGRGMRDMLAQTRIKPEEKVNRIQKMCKELFNQKCMAEWGLQLDMHAQQMETQILCPPQIFEQGQVVRCDEQKLRRLRIQKPVDLLSQKWIFVYQESNYHTANKVVQTMMEACRQLGIRVQEPFWIYLKREDDQQELDSWLTSYMIQDNQFRHPLIVLSLLGRENNYPMYKLTFEKYRMPSQVVTCRNANQFNHSKASNIIRQMNSKVGGDLFEMKFPEVITELKTMLIGIDVCHAGKNSVVGFAASTNSTLSQYFSDYIVQPKGQELVKNEMKKLIKEAIMVFQNQQKCKPSNFIIYRDGVGEQQRDQVLETEIGQFKDAIIEMYDGKEDEQPEITLIVVNKRITQRFFVTNEQGQLSNPPSGCIIDRSLVEQEGTNKPGVFDFYLTPANTTQGCVLPTHFFCAMNASRIGKLDLEHLTFALCHFYFNWAGPIKVPAPCQYAHKIAEFYTTVGIQKHQNQRRGVGQRGQGDRKESQCQVEVKKLCTSLNEKLHFL